MAQWSGSSAAGSLDQAHWAGPNGLDQRHEPVGQAHGPGARCRAHGLGLWTGPRTQAFSHGDEVNKNVFLKLNTSDFRGGEVSFQEEL